MEDFCWFTMLTDTASIVFPSSPISIEGSTLGFSVLLTIARGQHPLSLIMAKEAYITSRPNTDVTAVLIGRRYFATGHGTAHRKLEIAQSEQDVSPFCKESDMTYS